MLWSFVWNIAQNPNAFVDGVMNGFSLHIEPPSYLAPLKPFYLDYGRRFNVLFFNRRRQNVSKIYFPKDITFSLWHLIIESKYTTTRSLHCLWLDTQRTMEWHWGRVFKIKCPAASIFRWQIVQLTNLVDFDVISDLICSLCYFNDIYLNDMQFEVTYIELISFSSYYKNRS